MSGWRVGIAALVILGVTAMGFGLWRLGYGRHGDEMVPSDGGPSSSAQYPAIRQAALGADQARPATDPSTMYFTGLKLDTEGAAPQACLTFSLPLSHASLVHYEDYIRVDPAAKVSLQANGNRLCIGGLAFEKRYAVTIAQGLPAEGDAVTLSPETVPVSFGEMPPHVGFADSGFILSRDQVRGMPIETVNVDTVKVTVSRIGDRILARTELGKSWQDLEGEYDPETRKIVSNIAVPIWSGELSVKKRLNERVVTGFPIADILTPRKPGAYSIAIERVPAPGESRGRNTEFYNPQQNQRWIFDTDLMLTSFSGQDGLHVFVRSLRTAKPVAGAEVSLIATDNDELGVVKTDADGQAVFAAGLTRGVGALAPRMLMAYLADDFTAMELNRPGLDLSDQGVDGRDDAQAVDAFLYTDRGIYRPGETVDVTGLIRDRIGKALAPTPVSLRLVRPDGVEAGKWRLDPNEAGAVSQLIALSPSAARGTWRIEATLAGDKTVIGAQDIQVQDFVPQRLKVALSSDAKALTPRNPARIAIDARYLFGAPAAGLAVEGHVTFAVDPAPVADKNWRFGLVDDRLDAAPQDLTIAATDADGKAAALLGPGDITLPTTSLPLRATFDIGVVEPGGRITGNQFSLPVRVQPVLLGLRPTADGARVAERQKAGIEVALFSPDGARIARPRIDYRVIALNDNYSYYSEGGQWRWQRSTKERPILIGNIAVDADRPGMIQTPPLDWGRYRVEATDPETGVKSSLYVNAGWMTTATDNPAPEKVALSIDGAPVRPGATAHVRIKPPFAGEVLLTIANSRVFQARTFSIPAEGKTVDIEGSADWGPGAYVIASLYRPQASAEGHAPIRAVGTAWLPLDMSDRTLSVSIDAPTVARPRARVDVPVTVNGAQPGEPVYVTLAAVDEGILQLTRFASPDPNAHYFGKRRLAVDIRDDYAHLIDGDAAEPGDIRQGGDAGGGAGLSVVPTKTVALYSGMIKVGRDGKAMVPLDLPDFNGGLRLMAVAFNASAIGHAEAAMPVRDPVVGEISLPRFLAPGDQARMTLLANNVDGPAGTYHIHIAATGAVSAPPVDEDLNLAAAGQTIETFPISGGDPGVGQVELTMAGPGNLRIVHDWPIQVRPPHFPLTLGDVATQAPGESYRLSPALEKAFLPGTAKITISFSTMRGIDLTGLIGALDRYPYGCSEQQTSRALPLVYLEDLKLAAGRAAPDDEHLRVQAAIDTLLEREDERGAFGLWRLGDHWSTPFLGAYIVDFLARAKANGYAVPDEAMARAYKGMDTYENIVDWRANVFWAAALSQYRRDPIVAGQAYAGYVLARAKRADIGQLRYLHDTAFDRLEPVGKAQLGTALAMMGDRSRAAHAWDAAEREVLDPPPRWNWAGDYYRSPVRDLAILLTLAAELGDFDRVARLTAKLESEDTRTEQLDTQEQAWLSVAAATLLAKGGDVTISVNHAAAVPAKPPVTLNPDDAAIAAGYEAENKGQSPVFRAETEYGSPVVAPSAMANIVSVTKTVTAMDGSPTDLTAIKQNDRLVVHLSGRSDDDAYHQLILVDMLPAGWEIESVVPRGSKENGNGFPWLGALSSTKTAQKRDDRFVAAFDLGAVSGSHFTFIGQDDDDTSDSRAFNIAYVVRAVTPGQFVLPAAVLQDMYRPRVMARTAVGAITVAGKP
jgi:uncharacterized protein YfaS (alpha-2-macroglobulin family)